jgi:hypothetical protein
VSNKLERMSKESSWPNFKVLTQHLHRGTEENHKNLSQDCWSLDRDMSLRPSIYEAGVLTTPSKSFPNLSFTYHPIIRRYIVLVIEKPL